MYGGKQSARNWNQYLDELGLELVSEIHYIWANDDCMLALHVDDLILAYRSEQLLSHFIRFLAKDECKMNDLGEISLFIGVEIHRDRVPKILKIVQVGYVDQILARFEMTFAHPRNIPLDHEVLGVIGWKS